MKNEVLSLEQIQAFLDGNEEVQFAAQDRRGLYEWTEEILRGYDYSKRHTSDKGLVRRYIAKVTGRSRAQVTRLILISKKSLNGSTSRRKISG